MESEAAQWIVVSLWISGYKMTHVVGDDDAETARRLASSFNEDVTIAAVRRVPPLRIGYHSDWFPKISNADYADLFRDLRRGSKWGWDFITMLALAAAIASLGLLQNSAAVVIGSMLLAQLMVPMIGFGLALAQANVHLGITCARTIGLGTLLTLGVSFVL